MVGCITIKLVNGVSNLRLDFVLIDCNFLKALGLRTLPQPDFLKWSFFLQIDGGAITTYYSLSFVTLNQTFFANDKVSIRPTFCFIKKNKQLHHLTDPTKSF